MTHKRYFTITLHKENSHFRGAMAQKEIIVPEDMTVLDLKKVSGSSEIMKRDFSPSVLKFNPVSYNDKIAQGKEYELVTPDDEKLNTFIEQIETAVKNYQGKIPGTDYLMPPEGRERYPALLEKLVQELHQ